MLDPIKVQNKTAAPIQITAEQIVLESVNRMKDRAKLPNLEQTQQEEEDFGKQQSYYVKKHLNPPGFDKFNSL